MALKHLNVDLDIQSKSRFDFIISEFKSEDIEPLHYSKSDRGWEARIEVSGGGYDGCPDSVINCFMDIIEHFDNSAKDEWEQVTSKVFDIGFDVTDEEFRFYEELKPNTLKRVSKINASIGFTVYPNIVDKS